MRRNSIGAKAGADHICLSQFFLIARWLLHVFPEIHLAPHCPSPHSLWGNSSALLAVVSAISSESIFIPVYPCTRVSCSTAQSAPFRHPSPNLLSCCSQCEDKVKSPLTLGPGVFYFIKFSLISSLFYFFVLCLLPKVRIHDSLPDFALNPSLPWPSYLFSPTASSRNRKDKLPDTGSDCAILWSWGWVLVKRIQDFTSQE